ncbi:MAG: metal ABC transporter substrate-binding protein [Dehalococcoidia bacterium]|nr:metal ABC transporter substrate-binding protein [Dehalococcoidia bacterium]
MRRGIFLALTAIGLTLIASACSSGGTDDDERVRVVTSLPLLAEFATRVGGEDAIVSSIVPLGVDEHSFTPPTSAARDIAEAGLLLVNGYGLEEGLLALMTNNAADGVPVIPVARGLTPLEAHEDEEHEDEEHADEVPAGIDPLVFAEGDPHFWLDVANAIAYVNTIRDALIQVDAEHEAGYTERAAALVAELQALDTEVRDLTGSIPSEARRIVVFHNAFEYFAHAYEFEVFESVAPANPNQAASAQEIAAIIRSVREAGVPALYAEPQFSAGTLESIAAETGTRVLLLYSIPAEGAPTYAEMMRANARALAEGLGGG